MNSFFDYLSKKMAFQPSDKQLIKQLFIPGQVPANTLLLKAGQVERYLYFLSSGIVKGYQNQEGKLIVGHLINEGNFFGSMDSFIAEVPSIDYFETVTAVEYWKITKPDFELLKNHSPRWGNLIEEITNEHLQCKMDRIRDFQMLTAKERYQKFLKQSPNLALHVSVESIASFLGVEPPSLSRIRKQITIK